MKTIMHESDKTTALLRIAAYDLSEKIRPTLTGDERFSAAMIARALDVTARRLERQPALDEQMRTDMAGLLNLSPESGLDELRQTLIRRINDGHFDDERSIDLRRMLRHWTSLNLAISDPNYLKRLKQAGLLNETDGHPIP